MGKNKPRWLFRTLRVVEFVAILTGLIAVGFELYDRQQERGVRRAQMLIDLAVLGIEHGDKASPAIRSALEVLVLQGVPLLGFDFSSVDLRGARLSGASCARCDFSDVLAAGADFSGSKMPFASLEGAYMPDADLSDAVLANANLSNASFPRGTLARADLSHASLRGTTFDNADMSDVNLTQANVSGAYLHGLNLTQAQLDRACVSPNSTPRSLPEGLSAPQAVCDYI